jgi:Ca2+/H+ antiporter
MTRKIKIITSILLLLVFILPTVVKLEHHHKHFVSDFKNEKRIPVFHDNCPICNFEFSVFLSRSENVDLQKENPSDNYFNNYDTQFYSNLSQFSFSLRSPPDLQI